MNKQMTLFDMGAVKKTKKKDRTLPIDVISSVSTIPLCCIGVRAGLLYGLQSGSYSLCPNWQMKKHKVYFVDNNFKDYNHEKHLSVVSQLSPKYATVRDIMTQEQCNEAGIQYFEFEQIMEWAYELEKYAEKVIVIPKYDVLDKIPKNFVLGYSIPTSHGGTPLPRKMFSGRDVHLLGGSWKKQLEHMYFFGNDVVSLDNNHCHNISRYGRYYMPDGQEVSLSDFMPKITNHMDVCVALSFGAMAQKVKEMYGKR